MRRLAVVLFNLGGPDSLAAVRPFLRNLFSDPAILGVPWPLRPLLARLIAGRRARVARRIYARIGGRSPLLEQSEAQARALEAALSGRVQAEVRAFVSMRYWHPMSDAVAGAVRTFAPDRVVLLPLYPQYSLTTTGSSLKDWTRAAAAAGLVAPDTAVCCYPEQPGFVAAVAAGIETALADAARCAPVRVLFSAHGLPEKIIARGDPYQRQIERTAAAVVAALGRPRPNGADLDTVVCYQSRVGPLRWIGPSTEDELARAARDRRAVVVVPIAFVSEHSETLVELDIEYRERAEHLGVPAYRRVPTVGTDPRFIAGLADLVVGALGSGRAISGPIGAAACAASFAQCPRRSPPGGQRLAGTEA